MNIWLRLLLAAAGTIAILGCVSLAAYGVSAAFVLTGSHWDHPPTHTCSAIENAAIAVWATNSGMGDGGCGSDITVAYTADIPGPAIGLAGWSTGPGGVLSQCQILIENAYAANQLVHTHETGHCVGLGHSAVPNAIMYFSLSGSTHLTQDDVNGIQAIYGPPIGPPPPTPTLTFGTATIGPTLVATATAFPTATPTIGGDCVGYACLPGKTPGFSTPTGPTTTPTPPPIIRRAFIPGVARD